MFWRIVQKLFDWSSSLGLAVFIILSLAVVLAVGTVIEAKYTAAIASQEVYQRFWTQGLLALMMINVIAAAFSRWPWKKHHVGFLITHLGIVTLLVGSFLTQKIGIDGILALAPGEQDRQVRLDEKMLYVFRAKQGENYDLVFSDKLSLSALRPLKKPIEWKLDAGKLLLKNYYANASREIKVVDVPVGKGIRALKFQLAGSRANISDWLFLEEKKPITRDFGPAKISMQYGKPSTAVPEKPTIYIYFDNAADKFPKLATISLKDKKLKLLGKMEAGKTTSLGWMDFSFTMMEFHSSANPVAEYTEIPFNATNKRMNSGLEAISVEFNGDERWLELGSSAQFSSKDALYFVQYGNRQVDMGFDVFLKDFQVGYYQGTTRPKSYQSMVTVSGADHLISMNEPLKHGGFTLYQSSYEADESGKPVASIFSINYDPGRWVKYVGSLMIVFGTLSMFYFRPKYSGKSKFILKMKSEASNAPTS